MHCVFRAFKCTHCISRTYLLCVRSFFSGEISETPTHTLQQRQKKKRQTEWKERETRKDETQRKPSLSLSFRCAHPVSSVIVRLYLGLKALRGYSFIQSHQVTWPQQWTFARDRQGEISWDRCMKMPCVTFYAADRVISAFDWMWHDMNLTGEFDWQIYGGCVSKPCELLN